VGVQTFDDGLLERLRRSNTGGSGAEIRRRLAATCGMFPTVNVDMMYNLPGQTHGSLSRDLATILDIGPQQVTFYPLMVCATRAPFGRGQQGARRQARYYLQIAKAMPGRYRSATAWCFSLRSGQRSLGLTDEYPSETDEYAGLGAGSFGYVGGTLYATIFSVKRYIEALESGRLLISGARHLTVAERVRYAFLVKLSTGRLALDDLRRSYGPRAPWILWRELLFCVVARAIRLRRDRVTLTPRGRYYWVLLMQEFFTAVNRVRDRFRGTAAAWSRAHKGDRPQAADRYLSGGVLPRRTGRSGPRSGTRQSSPLSE